MIKYKHENGLSVSNATYVSNRKNLLLTKEVHEEEENCHGKISNKSTKQRKCPATLSELNFVYPHA